jgi:hypothetical protein
MPLAYLECQDAQVTDLSPLKGMLLEDIRLTPKKSPGAWIFSAT